MEAQQQATRGYYESLNGVVLTGPEGEAGVDTDVLFHKAVPADPTGLRELKTMDVANAVEWAVAQIIAQ